jgi:hypothetical protein
VDRQDPTDLERLESLTAELEELAVAIATKGKAFGPDLGARARIDLAMQRLRVALDELGSYPLRAEEIIADE